MNFRPPRGRSQALAASPQKLTSINNHEETLSFTAGPTCNHYVMFDPFSTVTRPILDWRCKWRHIEKYTYQDDVRRQCMWNCRDYEGSFSRVRTLHTGRGLTWSPARILNHTDTHSPRLRITGGVITKLTTNLQVSESSKWTAPKYKVWV